jgi:hypothetical protein
LVARLHQRGHQIANSGRERLLRGRQLGAASPAAMPVAAIVRHARNVYRCMRMPM